MHRRNWFYFMLPRNAMHCNHSIRSKNFKTFQIKSNRLCFAMSMALLIFIWPPSDTFFSNAFASTVCMVVSNCHGNFVVAASALLVIDEAINKNTADVKEPALCRLILYLPILVSSKILYGKLHNCVA